MAKNYEMAVLIDFYGEMLTAKQRDFLEYYYNDDLSLSEIAENEGITRQGVRDVLVRSEAILNEMEEKTGIVARFLEMQKISAEIENAAAQIQTINAERYQSTDLMELAQKIGKYAEMLKE